MRSVRVWLGFAISLVFLVLALRGQDLGQTWEALHGASYIWLLPALAAYFLGVLVRSVRWHYLLRSVRVIPARQLFPVVVIGYMANDILPLRAGELVRSYALSARFQVRKSAALATIAVERVFDGLTMLLFMLVASLAIAVPAELRWTAIGATGLFTLVLAVLFAIVLAPAARHGLIDQLEARLPERIGARLGSIVHAFADGLGILRSRQDLLSVALTSILAWLCEASMYLLIAEGFALDLSPLAILMVTAVANLATLVPSSPGYIGPFEWGVLLVLTGPLDVPREVALSYALVVHAALYFPVTALGLVYWWRESFSWREMRQTTEA